MTSAPRGLVATIDLRQSTTGGRLKQDRRFFLEIASAPVLADRIRDFAQPDTVFGQFEDFQRAKIFDRIRLRIAERPQETGRGQNGHVMSLTVEHPGDFRCCETGRKPTQQTQETLPIFIHGNCDDKTKNRAPRNTRPVGISRRQIEQTKGRINVVIDIRWWRVNQRPSLREHWQRTLAT